MDRRCSFGNASAGDGRPRSVAFLEGNVVNFPGNPRFRPRVAFKMKATTSDMEDKKELLANHAVLVKEQALLA
jgi:hypothetical protein